MLTSIRQVNEEFFKMFFNTSICVKGVEKKVNFRYFKKSAFDYVEEQENQIYPCIVIQDYPPNITEGYVDHHHYFGAISLDKLTGFLFHRPIELEFRYDVSIASKSYHDFVALQDYMNREYLCNVDHGLMFNKKFEGEDYVGDIVRSKVQAIDIPRLDGIHETNYEFTLEAWVYVREPEEVELIQKTIISARRSGSENPDWVLELGK